MKTKSEALIKAIADGTAGKPSIDIYIYSEYSTSEGGTIAEHLVDKDIWADGFKIEKATSSDNSFDVGGAIVGKLTFVVNRAYTHDDYTQSLNYYGKKCRVVLTYDVDGTQYPVEMGYFNIVDIQYNTQTTTFTAYDDLYLFDKPYTDSKITFPATLQEIVTDACSCCNVKWDGKAFRHDDYVINSKPDKVTFREMLAYIGQITCHFARMTADGFLEFAWYQNTDDNKWNQKSSYSRDAAMQPVTITGTRLIYRSKSKDSTEMETEVMSGTNGYMITIQNNPLIDICSTSPQLICDNLLADLKKTPAFLPGKMDIPANPLIDCGDIIGYWSESKQAYLYDTLVTGISYSQSEKTEIRCGGDSSTRISSTQYDVSTKNDLYTYDLLKANRAYEKSEREKAIADLTEKISNSSGLFTTKQTDSSGATIYYMHDLPELSESKIIWKMTSEAVAVSTDGGKTYNAGITVNGDAIARILNATGINADWIRTGTLSADLIKTGSLSADLIKSGKLNSQYIGAGKIELLNDALEFYSNGTRFAKFGESKNLFGNLSIGDLQNEKNEYYNAAWVDIKLFRKIIEMQGGQSVVAYPYIILNSKPDDSRTRIYDDQIEIDRIGNWSDNSKPTIYYWSRFSQNKIILNGSKNSLFGYLNINCDAPLYTLFELSGGQNKGASFKVSGKTKPKDGDTYYLKFDDVVSGSAESGAVITHGVYNLSTNANIMFGDSRKAEIAGATIDQNTLTINNVKVSGSLEVEGTKSRVASTSDYGDRQLYCYETPTPYFGDIGEGEIADDGNCYIFIDPIFAETVTASQYQVFLQAYGSGELFVKDRKSNYFIVSGTPGLKFGWEMKAKQAGFDQLRIKQEIGDDEIKQQNNNFADLAVAHIKSIQDEYKNTDISQTEKTTTGGNEKL